MKIFFTADFNGRMEYIGMATFETVTALRLSTSEAKQILKIKDSRTLKRWCVYHQIDLLSDLGSRKKYILKSDFDAAILRATISHLRDRYGEIKWRDALQSHLRTDVMGLISLNDFIAFERESQVKSEKSIGQRFLNELSHSLNTIR